MSQQTKPTVAEEHFARVIAFWHGATMVVGRKTIAALAGYGEWGWSAEKYSDAHWPEYLGAARAIIEARNV